MVGKFRRMFTCIISSSLVLSILLTGLSAYAANTATPAGSDKLTEGVATATELGLVPSELLSKDLNAPITRAEFCALLEQASHEWGETQVVGIPTFSDTEDEAVGFCAGLEIVNGYPDGTFRPDNFLSREEAAAMLHRAAEAFDVEGDGILMPHDWQDSVSAWCHADVSWCYFNGIMEGTGDNRFSGNDWYTRAQAIVTALRLDQLTKGTVDKKTDYYPLYTTAVFEPDHYGFFGADSWLTSDGARLTDEEMRVEHPEEYSDALENCVYSVIKQYGIPTSRLLPDNFLGEKLYIHELGFFMNRSVWITDIYGNAIDVPNAGNRFASCELYYMPDGCLAANFATVQDPSADFSDPVGMVFYNLTTGEQLSTPAPAESSFEQEPVTFVAAGNGIYAVESQNGSITVYGADANPVHLNLQDGDWVLLGFSQGLLVLQNNETKQLTYCTPYGEPVATAESAK